MKEMARSFLWMIRRGLRRMSLDVSIFDKQSPDFQLAGIIRRRKIECILDVGANRGQFARYMGLQGVKGTIYSVEPVPAAFAQLADAAGHDDNWHVYNVALSDRSGTASLNVGANDQTSSLLGASSRHGPQLVEFTGSVNVECRRLDEMLELELLGCFNLEQSLLKMDVQGHELQVLKGLGEKLRILPAAFMETSLVEIYDAEPEFIEISSFLRSFGFAPLTFKGGLHHPDHGYLMQIDVLFENFQSNTPAINALTKASQ